MLYQEGDNNGQQVTSGIANKGFRGMRSSPPASIFSLG